MRPPLLLLASLLTVAADRARSPHFPLLPRLPDGAAGDDAIAAVLEGVRDAWERLISGVRSSADDAAQRLQSHVEEARTRVEGVAKDIQTTVDGAAQDVGDVIGSIVKNTNPAIFPGTNWCGAGDRANGFNHTGVFVKADRCCREHDSCPDSIPAGASKHGLKNEAPYTLSLCACDTKFHRCLKESGSFAGQNIGVTYFNILKMKCFTYDHPMACKKESSANNCEEYRRNSTVAKIWQLLDNPGF